MAGISFGGTNEPTSISRRPAAASAAIQAFFASVGIKCFAFCSPSRGPTSQMWTCGMGPQAAVTGIFSSMIFFDHSAGPVVWTEVPFASTATVTGISFTSNS